MSPEKFVKEYELALGTQEWKNVAPLVRKNANVTFSNGQVHQGKGAIKIAFEKNFSSIKNELYEIQNLRWLLKTTTTAVYLFDFRWKGIINNEPAQGKGIGTSVLVHENGQWLLLAEHLGSAPKNQN